MNKNAVLLGAAQFLFMVYSAVGVAFIGLVGVNLAPDPSLATVPYLIVTASTMVMALFMPKVCAVLGYKKLFIVGALMGGAGGLLGAWAVIENSFFIFSIVGILVGAYQASALYYRFSAADGVEEAKKSSAIALVLSGGIFAAFVGPEFGTKTADLIQGAEYAGAFAAVGLLSFVALPFFALLAVSNKHLPENVSSASQQQAQINAKSWYQLVKENRAASAMVLCAGGYLVMVFVMIASPLAVSGHGYATHHAASVIQWHLLGMFAPSLITGKLISRFGTAFIAWSGVIVLAIGCVTAILNAELFGFRVALLLVGVGWNFMYMSGSTMLASIVDPVAKAKIQSINESATFGLIAVSSALTGWVYHEWGWVTVAVVGLLLTIIVAIFFACLQRSVARS